MAEVLLPSECYTGQSAQALSSADLVELSHLAIPTKVTYVSKEILPPLDQSICYLNTTECPQLISHRIEKPLSHTVLKLQTQIPEAY